VLNANLRDGSLRQAVLEKKIPMLLYEGGEALRFDEGAIGAGLQGVIRVMRELGMLPKSRQRKMKDPFIAQSSHWLRAPDSGILRERAQLGVAVRAGQVLGIVSDPLGANELPVVADRDGVVVGRSELPLVNEGDAIFHIATFDAPTRVASSVEDFHENLADPLLDEG